VVCRAAAQPLALPPTAAVQEASGVHSLSVALAEPGYAAPHFATECFALATRALHVGLLPAVHRHQAVIQVRSG